MTRGQASFFLVMGALMVVIGGAMYVTSDIYDKSVDPAAHLSNDRAAQLTQFVEDCLAKTVDVGIRYLALQGGYYDVFEHYEDMDTIRVPYYFSGWEPISTVKAASELEKFIVNNLDVCTQEFVAFDQYGSTITSSALSPRVLIQLDKTSVQLSYPITLIDAGETFELSSFETTVHLPYGNLLNVMQQGIPAQREALPYVAHLAFMEPAYDAGYNYSHVYPSLLDVVHIITAEVSGQDLSFAFATQHEWPEFEPFHYFEEIPVLTGSGNEPITYEIQGNYDALIYSHDSELVTVSDGGRIYFDPYAFDANYHSFVLTATRPNGESQSQEVDIRVTGSSISVNVEAFEQVNASVGENVIFFGRLTADSAQNVLWSDDADEFDIHPTTGRVSFTPVTSGTFTARITAANTEDSDYEYVTVVVS